MGEPIEPTSRRAFLGATAAGGIGVLVSGAGTTAAESGIDVEFGCSFVDMKDEWFGEARVDFRDGSFVHATDGTPNRLGSPGRVLETLRVPAEVGRVRVIENPNVECDPGEPVTTFDHTSVTVPSTEFSTLGRRPLPQGTTVTLFFADGAPAVVFERPGVGEYDAVPTTFSGTGDNAGKVVEGVLIEHDGFFTRRFLRNRHVDATLLGAGSVQERLVEVVATQQGELHYEMTVGGPVAPVRINDQIGAGGNDSITDNGDGTYTVTGFTGNRGYGDAYRIEGEIVDVTRTGGESDYVLRELSRSVVRDGTGASHSLAVVTVEDGELAYEFTVDGPVYRRTQIGEPNRAEDNDAVAVDDDGTRTVSGYTGNEGYGDTYGIGGPVTAFRKTGGEAEFRLYLDSQPVTPKELLAGIEGMGPNDLRGEE